jgi:hypothetical protein
MGDGLALDHFSPIESVSTSTFKDVTWSTNFFFYAAVGCCTGQNLVKGIDQDK